MKLLFLGVAMFFSLKAFNQSPATLVVYFDSDKFALGASGRNALDSSWEVDHKNYHTVQYDLVGYCDSRASDEYNASLSLKRARAVQNYLLKKGAGPKDFLNVKGEGEKDPLNTNSNEEEWKLNRRVVITITRGNIIEARTKDLKEVIADSATLEGTNLILRNINFVGGMHTILPESSGTLHELLDALRSNPKLVIRIEGHICCEAGIEDGMDNETGLMNLSEGRARAIHDWLISQGISKDRLSYKGLGHSRPLYPYPEQNEEEKKENRRVEITIIKK